MVFLKTDIDYDPEIQLFFKNIIEILVVGTISIMKIEQIKTIKLRHFMNYFNVINIEENLRELFINKICNVRYNEEPLIHPRIDEKYCKEIFQKYGYKLNDDVNVYVAIIIDTWCNLFLSDLNEKKISYPQFIELIHQKKQIKIYNEKKEVQPINFIKAINLKYQ